MDAGPAAVGAARIVLGGALLAAWAFLPGARGRRPGAGRRWRLRRRDALVLAVGALGVAAYQPAFFAGTASTGVAVGTLVALGSAPVATGLLEWLLLRRAPGRRWAVATALAATGVGVLALGGGGGTALEPLGVLAALGAGVSYAVYTLSSKALLRAGWRPDAVMGATFGVAGLLLLPVLLATGPGWLATGRGAATAVFLAVVPTALAYVLFVRGLRRLSAAETATWTLAEPLTAATLGVLLLAEPVTVAAALGAAVLLAGLVVLAAPARARGAAVAEGLASAR